MPENKLFPPEGLRPPTPCSLPLLQSAAADGSILEGCVDRCDGELALHLSLDGIRGYIPPSEVLSPWISGAQREISVLSRVGRRVCFTVQSVTADEKGAPLALLSRADAQERALDWFLTNLRPGSVITARITSLAPFGAFADIGCGVIAMLPLEHISVSRISHPSDRFSSGQKILAVIRAMDPERRRFTLTHRELLGTWMENASRFQVGDTVTGIVRSIREYGTFIELTPNLSGLADNREGICEGDAVSVRIRSIRPENMKVKLQLIDRLPPPENPAPLRYQITDGVLERWIYSPPGCVKTPVETDFTEARP